jgi:protein dithiol:quinone oxidoreductase
MRRWMSNFAGALVCALLLGYAYYLQFVQHLEPCPLCIFQRAAVFALGCVFLLATIHQPRTTGARIYAVLIVLCALAGIGVAARHIYVQSLPPGSVPSCGATLDYMLEVSPVAEVIRKVLTGSGECATINWSFLGLSMPWWVLIWCVVLGTAGVIVNWEGSSSGTPSMRRRRVEPIIR